HLRVEVGALQTNAAGAGEAIEDEVPATTQQTGLEPVDLLGHLDGVVAIDPTSGLDVDRLAGVERLLEHVARAVDPDHALSIAGEELIHPEAAAVEHVGEPLDPAVVILDARGRGQELVLANDDALSRRQVESGNVAWRIATERDLAGGL